MKKETRNLDEFLLVYLDLMNDALPLATGGKHVW
jgi:hypothetical protein